MAYYTNDIVRISGSFDNSAGVATDPTGLTLVIKARPVPGRTTTATTVQYNPGDIVRDSAGEFHYDWTVPTVTRPTTYDVQWQPTGAVQRASEPDAVYARPLIA